MDATVADTSTTDAQRRVSPYRRVGSLLMAVFVAVAAVVVLPVTDAGATTLQSTVLSPVDGAVSSNPEEPHHRPYGGDYSFDVHTSRTKRPVFARYRNTNGSLSLSVAQVAPACASGRIADGGYKLVLNVMINGAKVGTVTYSHLASIRYSSGGVPVGAHVGDVATAADGLAASSCWTGPHVHVEPRNDRSYGCYFSRPLNSGADGSTALGLIGGERAGGVNQRCPANAEVSGRGNAASVPEGAFMDTDAGRVYRKVGGSAVWIRSWTHVGGAQATTPVTQASVDALPLIADGTLVNTEAGRVYQIIGNHPFWVSGAVHNRHHNGRPNYRISQWSIDTKEKMRSVPRNGAMVGNQDDGRVHVFAHGAYTYVSSYSRFPNRPPTYPVDSWMLRDFSTKLPEGSAVCTTPNGYCYQIRWGMASYISSWSQVPANSGPTIDQWWIDNRLGGSGPFGSFTSAAAVGNNQIRVRGWAIDPDMSHANSPGEVVITVGQRGKPVSRRVVATANVAVAGLGGRYPGAGDRHGFDVVVPVDSNQTVDVKVEAINRGVGANRAMGVASVTIPK